MLCGKTRKVNWPQTLWPSPIKHHWLREKGTPSGGCDLYTGERGPRGAEASGLGTSPWSEGTDWIYFYLRFMSYLSPIGPGMFCSTKLRWDEAGPNHLQGTQGRMQMLTTAELLSGQQQMDLEIGRCLSKTDRSLAPGFDSLLEA